MRGNGITNDGQFAALALSTISEFMAEDGYQEAFEKFVAPNCNAINFGKSLNRSVTGSMNDLINHATICLTELGMSPLQVGFKLNGVLLSALATEEFQGYGKPNEAFCRLVVQQVND